MFANMIEFFNSDSMIIILDFIKSNFFKIILGAIGVWLAVKISNIIIKIALACLIIYFVVTTFII